MARNKRYGEREGARGQRGVVTAFVIALVAGGCDSTHFLGGGGGGSGGTVGGQGSPFLPFDAGYPGDVSGLGETQSWTGYLENHQVSSPPTDVIKLSFASDSNGVVVGTLTFGTLPPPPRATDPNVGYPPDLPTPFLNNYIAQGFPYTIANGSLVGERLRFEIWTDELWTGWCGLQIPPDGNGFCVPTGNNGYTAALSAPCSITIGSKTYPEDCAKLMLCSSLDAVCACSTTACYPDLSQHGLSVDLTFAGTTASGSFARDISANIHLTKDP